MQQVAEKFSQPEINIFVESLAKAVKKFGVRNIALKLGELLSIDANNINNLIESRINDEILKTYGIAKVEKEIKSKNRGIKLEANVMKVILLYIHCDLKQSNIAIIMNEDKASINRKINAFHNYATNKPIKGISEEKVFTDKFMEKFEVMNNRIGNYVTELKSKL